SASEEPTCATSTWSAPTTLPTRRAAARSFTRAARSPVCRHRLRGSDGRTRPLARGVETRTLTGGCPPPSSHGQDGCCRHVPALDELGAGRHPPDPPANRRDVRRDRKTRKPVVVVTEHHSPRAAEVALSGDELRQAPLDRPPVDVPAPRRCQDRD